MNSRAFRGLVICTGLLVAGAMPAVRAQDAPKIAVINVVQLLEESDEGKKGIDALKSLQKQKADERSALQGEIADLRAKISDGQFSLTEEKLADLKKQLEDKLIALQRFSDDATRDLQKQQEAMLLKIQSKVMPIINAVGKERGYTMIFNKFESGLVYADDAIDITAEVMSRLNSAADTESADSGS